MNDGSIWFIGGKNNGQVMNTTVQRLPNGTFIPGPDTIGINAGGMENACGFQINATHIFIAGGRSNDPIRHLESSAILDIVSHTWTIGPNMTHMR